MPGILLNLKHQSTGFDKCFSFNHHRIVPSSGCDHADNWTCVSTDASGDISLDFS